MAKKTGAASPPIDDETAALLKGIGTKPEATEAKAAEAEVTKEAEATKAAEAEAAPVAVPTWLYSAEVPKGRIFHDAAKAAEAVKDGWVDSPAKIK